MQTGYQHPDMVVHRYLRQVVFTSRGSRWIPGACTAETGYRHKVPVLLSTEARSRVRSSLFNRKIEDVVAQDVWNDHLLKVAVSHSVGGNELGEDDELLVSFDYFAL